MSLVTGGMGGLGSICSFICAQEGMGPVMTTSRTGALPTGNASLNMLESIMATSTHISIKGDMGQSNAVADMFAWLAKMGKNGIAMEQQMITIDEITTTLKYQMSFSEKRKSSLKSTLEVMTWVRDRYQAALEALKNQTGGAGADAKTKQEFEDMMLKITELISDIKKKLQIPEGLMVSENALKQARRKAAQLSEAVADVERMSCFAQDGTLGHGERQQELPKEDLKTLLLQNLMRCVSQIQSDRAQSAECEQQWIVIGGGNSQGIFVQYGSEAMADTFQERLATGALVEGLMASEDGKLLYKKIQGEGPEYGWVCLADQGLPLLKQVNETELE